MRTQPLCAACSTVSPPQSLKNGVSCTEELDKRQLVMCGPHAHANCLGAASGVKREMRRMGGWLCSPWLAHTQAEDDLCNGVFIMRATPMARRLLALWWRLGREGCCPIAEGRRVRGGGA